MTEYTRGSGFGRFVLIVILLLIVAVAGVWYYNRDACGNRRRPGRQGG